MALEKIQRRIESAGPPFCDAGISEWHWLDNNTFIPDEVRHSVTLASASGTEGMAEVYERLTGRHSVTLASASGTGSDPSIWASVTAIL